MDTGKGNHLDGYIALESPGQKALPGKRYEHFNGFLGGDENAMG